MASLYYEFATQFIFLWNVKFCLFLFPFTICANNKTYSRKSRWRTCAHSVTYEIMKTSHERIHLRPFRYKPFDWYYKTYSGMGTSHGPISLFVDLFWYFVTASLSSFIHIFGRDPEYWFNECPFLFIGVPRRRYIVSY